MHDTTPAARSRFAAKERPAARSGFVAHVRSAVAGPIAGGIVSVLVAALMAGCSGAGEEPTPSSDPAPLVESEHDVVVETPDDLPDHKVFRPAELAAIDGPVPVIAWASNGCRNWVRPWEPLLTRWAASGLVVVAAVSTDAETADPVAGRGSDAQAMALDWATQQNDVEDGPLAGRVDLARLAVAGDYCGGPTAVGAGDQDDRVAAVLVLADPSAVTAATTDVAASIEQVAAPVAVITGESGESGDADGGLAGVLATAALEADVAAYVADRAEGGHQVVGTTDVVPVEEAAHIGLLWWDLALNGNELALRGLLDEPCPRCVPGIWRVRSHDLGSLVER